jgi:hypothetical protein
MSKIYEFKLINKKSHCVIRNTIANVNGWMDYFRLELTARGATVTGCPGERVHRGFQDPRARSSRIERVASRSSYKPILIVGAAVLLDPAHMNAEFLALMLAEKVAQKTGHLGIGELVPGDFLLAEKTNFE